MTIQPIGSASVALYITPADLKEHGLTPAGLTLERALAITQTAFHEAGITLEGSIEIEAYPDACGVLVFAHVRAPERAGVVSKYRRKDANKSVRRKGADERWNL